MKAPNCQQNNDMLSHAMLTQPLSECKLDWKPLVAPVVHETLPAYSWKGQVLIGHQSEVKDVIPLDHLDLHQALVNFYPKLSFVELARIESSFDLDENSIHSLYEAYGFRRNAQSAKVARLCLELPEEFLIWAHTKNFGIRDLAALLPLKELRDIHFVLETLVNFQMSNSGGRQALRLCSELLLMDHTQDELLLRERETTDSWLERLNSMRFPLSTHRDGELKKKVKETLAPPHVEAQWVRKGDLTGLQLGVFCVSSRDLDSRLSALEKYKMKLAEKLGSLWTQ